MKIDLELLTMSPWTPKDYVDWYAMEMLNQHFKEKANVWFVVNLTREYIYWMRQDEISRNMSLEDRRLWADGASYLRTEGNKEKRKVALDFGNKNIRPPLKGSVRIKS